MKDPLHAISVAGNGLLDRRTFLSGAVAGLSLLAATPDSSANTAPMRDSRRPGAAMRPYGLRSPFEQEVTRLGIRSQPNTTGSGGSATPLERLAGTLTPSALHFERHHAGVPSIHPSEHRLVLHGLIERPLVFDLESLSRYPMVSATQFLECSGNSAALLAPEPMPLSCGELHGLISCSEWTGIPLKILLDEAGVSPEAHWIVAEGSDAARMNRSVPLAKAMDDALVALYQNGERLRPENGYPMRLFLPGFEGNMSIKWLRGLQVTRSPAMSREETSKYSDLQPSGRARFFSFPMDVKSVITSPSPGLQLQQRGVYQITGLAWSGTGRIKRVEVSADGGKTWGEANLEASADSMGLSRFRIPWHWRGQPATLMSRAFDRRGAAQPTRDRWLAERGPNYFYHYNAVQAWRVDTDGSLKNVYA